MLEPNIAMIALILILLGLTGAAGLGFVRIRKQLVDVERSLAGLAVQAEAQAAYARELEVVLDSQRDPLLLVREGQVVLANKAARLAFGELEPGGLLGREVAGVLGRDVPTDTTPVDLDVARWDGQRVDLAVSARFVGNIVALTLMDQTAAERQRRLDAMARSASRRRAQP